MHNDLHDFLTVNPVIAAVRDDKFSEALASDVGMIFHLNANLLTVEDRIHAAHAHGKRLLIHMDLTEGIGRDRTAVRFLAARGADGVISTHAALIRAAREEHLLSIQRFFALDTQGVSGIPELVRQSAPDLIEIMPGMVLNVIRRLSGMRLNVIAGGLIESKSDVTAALGAGAMAVSTGKSALWSL